MAGLRFCSLTTFYPPFNFGGDGIFYDTSRQGSPISREGLIWKAYRSFDSSYDLIRKIAEKQKIRGIQEALIHE